MALNRAQFEALFTNAFGNGTADFGLAIDATAEDAVARKGTNTVELLVVQNRAIEWRVNGSTLIAWKQYGRDDDQRHLNGAALRAHIG